MRIKSLLVVAFVASAAVLVPDVALADHCGDVDEAPCAIDPVNVGFIVADVALLGIDTGYAIKGGRPGRLYGGLEVAFGAGQLAYAFANAVTASADETWNTVNAVAASAIIVHGAYVLVRGGKAAPRERASVAPMASGDAAGLMVFGTF